MCCTFWMNFQAHLYIANLYIPRSNNSLSFFHLLFMIRWLVSGGSPSLYIPVLELDTCKMSKDYALESVNRSYQKRNGHHGHKMRPCKGGSPAPGSLWNLNLFSRLPEFFFWCSPQKNFVLPKSFLVSPCSLDICEIAPWIKFSPEVYNWYTLCSVLPKLLSSAPCSLVIFASCSWLPACFGPHSTGSLKPLPGSPKWTRNNHSFFGSTMLVKSFAHLNRIFFLDPLKERGKLWKWLTLYSGIALFILDRVQSYQEKINLF